MSTSLRIACVRISRRPTDAPAPAEGWGELARALLEVAPRVTPLSPASPSLEAPLGAWADVSGMERRGSDAALAQALLAAARSAGFAGARVGVAGTCVAAALATRERGSAWRVVPSGRDASFVARRPLALLPMGAELRASLQGLGLRSCAELARLSAADVELRFGAEGVRVWRLARGEDARWPFRPAPADAAVAEVELDAPVETLEPLRFLLRGLIPAVLRQLAGRQRIPAALRLTLLHEGAGQHTLSVAPARPTADERVLADLCWNRLEEQAAAGGLTAPVVGIRLEAGEEGAARADQTDLFLPAAPDPAAVHAALLPLLARWGEDALSRAAVRGAHLPAARAVWEAAGARAVQQLCLRRAAPAEGVDGPPATAELPLCLRRLDVPHPVTVEPDPAGRPAALHTSGERHELRAEGPERLSGRWWDAGYAREYWLAEGRDGRLWLLFRDAREGGWFLEGWYD